MSIVLTKAALALKNAESNFEVVKFASHKSKKKTSSETQDTNDNNEQNKGGSKKEVDLKKIRHEIVKFGMSGFDKNKKEEAKIALAVSLGAKPPKREYINYKELMQRRKEEKKIAQQEKDQMLSKSIMHKVGKKKHKGVSNDVGHLLSSYGKVNKKELNSKADGVSKKKKKK